MKRRLFLVAPLVPVVPAITTPTITTICKPPLDNGKEHVGYFVLFEADDTPVSDAATIYVTSTPTC